MNSSLKSKIRVLVVSSEIIKDRYSSSLITANFLTALSSRFETRLLVPQNTIFNFPHELERTEFIQPHALWSLCHLPGTRSLCSRLGFRSDVWVRISSARVALENLRESEFDIQICFGAGGNFAPHFASVKTQPSKCVKVGYIHDPFPGDAYPDPFKRPESRLSRSQRKQFQTMADKMDYLMFPSLRLAEWMANQYHISPEKTVIVPHPLPGVRSQEDSLESQLFLTQHGLRAHEYFLHTGTLLGPRRIDTVVESFRALKDRGELAESKIVFIGNAHYPIEHLHADDVVIIDDRLPYQLVTQLCQRSQGLLIIEHIGEMSPFLPGKFPEYIAIGVPILHFGPKDSEVRRLMQINGDDAMSAPLCEPASIMNVFRNAVNKSHFRLSDELRQYFSPETLQHTIEVMAKRGDINGQ